MSKWRRNITELIEFSARSHGYKLHIVNPVDYFNFEEKRHKSEREVMDYDLRHVRTSDLIIVNLKDINTSIGTCIELYVAHQLGIPVLAFLDDCNINIIHPWILECIDRIEESDVELVQYLSDFYFI